MMDETSTRPEGLLHDTQSFKSRYSTMRIHKATESQIVETEIEQMNVCDSGPTSKVDYMSSTVGARE